MRLGKARFIAVAVAGSAAAASCNLTLGLDRFHFDATGSGGASSASSSGTGTGTGGAGGSVVSASSSSSSSSGTGGGGGAPVPDAGIGAPGTALWSVGFGSGQTFTVGGVGVDAAGDVYVTGSFQGMVTTGPCGSALAGPDGSSVAGYLIKLGTDGACKWASSFGAANGTTVGTAIAVSPAGEITLAATYAAKGLAVPGSLTLLDPNGIDAFVVRYPAGYDPGVASKSAVWLQHLGDTGDQVISSVTLDSSGGAFVAGTYQQSLITLPAMALSRTGTTYKTGFAILLAAADGSPSATSLRLFPATTSYTDVEPLTVAFHTPDTVVVAGRTNGGIDFGDGPETPANGLEGFFGEYAGAGLPYVAGGWYADIGDEQVRHAGFGPGGDLYLAGTFADLIDFHGGVQLPSGGPAAFLAHLDPQGKAQQAIALGYVNDVDKTGVRFAMDPASGDLVFAGTLGGPINLPGVTAGAGVSNDDDNVVVGRIDSAISTATWLKSWGDSAEQGADAIALEAQGRVVIAGHFKGTLTIDGSSAALMATNNGTDLFVAKLWP